MIDLMGYLPAHYRNSPEVAELQEGFGRWAGMLRDARDGLFEQLHARSATWGLRLWEESLGIEPDISKPEAFRLARIESKLRGLGGTTAGMIANVAESFSNGSVDIAEHAAEYRFDVVFTGTVGIPPNMADLTEAIEGIKPAHLAFSYVFTYRTWGMVSHTKWGAAAAYTWNQLREGSMA